MRSGKKKRKDNRLWTFHRFSTQLLEKEKGGVELKSSAILRMILIYPNSYAVGMASLGFQTVYRIVNQHPEVVCERGFVWDEYPDFSGQSIESSEKMNQFDLVGFSISYELDIPRIIKCLLESGIPIKREDRTDKDPIVIVGGAVAGLNPSPLLPFMDGLLVGEGEGKLLPLVSTLAESKKKNLTRHDKLESISILDGIFCPGIHKTVKRHTVASLENHPTFTPIITPESHFDSMFVVELSRGCPRPCLFCAGQKVYHPIRIHSGDSILKTVREENPGATKIGLEGSAISDHPELRDICTSLVDDGYKLGLSSLRPGIITEELLDIIIRGQIRSITIAPETGTETLRFRLGKKVTNNDILETCALLKDTDIEWLKLYFIIGFPGETIEDVQAIPDLVLACYDQFQKKGKRKRIRVSINSFIPKPFTEFQWAPMDEETLLIKKRKMIEQVLKRSPGIKVTPKSIREEIRQGELSMSNQAMGNILLYQVQNSVSLKKAIQDIDMAYQSKLHEERSLKDDLPWNFIQSSIPHDKLWKRYRNYVEG